MTELTLVSGGLTLVYLFVAVTAFWAVLRWLDRLSGLTFREHVIGKIRESALSTSIYYGARVVAVAVIVASVLS